MKLLGAQVTNYKSIDDSGWVEFGNVTCLVGKNESGKTAFLQAIQRLSPAPGVKIGFDLTDYPRKGYTRYKRQHEKQPATIVCAKFELSAEEIARIEGEFGEGVLESPTMEAHKDYSNTQYWSVAINERAVVRHLLDKAALPDHVFAKVENSPNLDTLLGHLETESDQPPSIIDLIATLRTQFDQSVKARIIHEFLAEMVPYFVYFSDYSTMGGRIAIQALKQRQDNDTLSDADRTFLSLLSLVGADLVDLEDEQDYERLTAELEGASNKISDEVFEFWSQNKQLAVRLALSNANPSDPSPLNSGAILNVRIENQRHRVTVPFDERSRGFVWFFSFLAYFSELEDETRDLVLLLDEPGLSLHAKAQSDFLRFIDERLAPKHQVIYTTHSPFMINPAELNRVRTVQDVDERGTVISADVLKNDRDTVFPLQAALGYELAQTLFVGPHNLLVEGPSDLVYLQVMSRILEQQGQAGLDPRWVLVPVGGADKVSTFVSLLGGNKLHVAVLIDTSTKEMQRIRTLQSNHLIGANSLIQLSEFTGGDDADIEDMFEPGFYLELVNGAFTESLDQKLKLSDLTSDSQRIVERLSQYFKNASATDGRFDHYQPAVFLLTEQSKLIKKINEDTIGRFSALFQRVNSLLQ